MQINAIRNAIPRAIRVLPIAATMALSAITLSAKAQDNNTSKVESDSITNIVKGTIAVNDGDSITQDSTNIVLSKDTVLFETDKQARPKDRLGFNVEGTGAEELLSKAQSNLTMANVGSTFAGIHKALNDTKKELTAKGQDDSDISTQISAIKDLANDYTKDRNELIRENVVKSEERVEFKYGENQSKTGTITQTIMPKMNGGIKDRTTADSNDSTAQNRQFDGGAVYELTLKTQNGTDTRFIADLSSDNVNLSLAGLVQKKLESGTLSAALVALETIEPKYHEGCGGVAIDYADNNSTLTTGAYANYEYSKDHNIPATWKICGSGYLKYKDNVRLEIGDEYSMGINYLYSKINLIGRKKFPDNSIYLSGRLSGEYGANIFPKDSSISPLHNLELNARGSLIFNPVDDISASIGTNIRYELVIDPDETSPDKKFDHDVSASLLGSFQKGKMGISAMLSFLYSNYQNDTYNIDPLKIAASVSVRLQDLFKGITPFLSYTINTGVDGREHNLGGGLTINPHELAKTKKK